MGTVGKMAASTRMAVPEDVCEEEDGMLVTPPRPCLPQARHHGPTWCVGCLAWTSMVVHTQDGRPNEDILPEHLPMDSTQDRAGSGTQ